VWFADVPATVSYVKYDCCETPYVKLTFSLRLRRKPFYFVINLLVPSIIFSVLTFIALMLQPGCSERIGLGAYTVTALTFVSHPVFFDL